MDKQLEERISKLAHDFAADMITLMKESKEPVYFNIGILTRDKVGNGNHDYYHFAFRQDDEEKYHDESKVNYYD